MLDHDVAVRAAGLTLAHGRTTVLADVTVELQAGRTVALIGPNGAGKTTLLNAIAGLHPPTAGTLEVPAAASPAGVAYVLQATAVNPRLPLTVREAVTMGRYARTGPFRRLGAEDRDAVARALDRLHIADLANRQLHELSGGQRQRTFVAQGLAQEADLLLLDEPFTGLDLVSRERILEVVAEERQAGRTVILTTHDLGDASRAGHVLLLAGRLVASGPPAAVLCQEHLQAAYGAHLVRVHDGTIAIDDRAHC